MQKIAQMGLASTHAAGVRIVWSAGRNRQHAGAGDDGLVLRSGAGSLGGGGCTGKDEDDDESANDMFHDLELRWSCNLLILISLVRKKL